MAHDLKSFSIADTYGVFYIGVVLGAVMYGITVMQTYTYSTLFPDDRRGLKLFVVYIFLLDTFHQAVVTYSQWHYFVESFLKPQNLLVIDWSSQVYLGVSVWIRCSVQIFYTYRIWALTRNRLVCGIIVVFCILNLAFSGYFESKIIESPRWADLRSQTWITDVSISCSIVADIVIAATMSIVLRRRTSSYDRTRGIIQQLITYAVGTGVLTVILSLLTLVLVATSTSFAAELLYNVLSKLYTNSALISLNARDSLRAENPQSLLQFGSNITSNSHQLSNIRSPQGTDHHPAVVHVHKTTTSDRLHTESSHGDSDWEPTKVRDIEA